MTAGGGLARGAAAPVVSVALGTHNGARFVSAQAASILDQTTAVDEIVLSDDASTDDTVAIVEAAVAAVPEPVRPRLVVLRNSPALGVTANFEQALRAATGEFVLLSDQDDVWRSDRVEATLAAFAERPAVEAVASDARFVDADGVPFGNGLFAALGVDGDRISRLEAGGAVDELLRRNLFTGATMAVRRALVERAAPFPGSWVHDEWLAMAAALGGGIAVVREPLIDYRQHGGNQIGAAELDLRGRIDRLRRPRTDRNARLLARATALTERGPVLGASSAQATWFAAKVAHERARSALPVARVARIAPVWRIWRSGGYGRFGGGAQDALRDLVQPV